MTESVGGNGLLDYEAAALYLATTPRHLRRLWTDRRINGVKVGRYVNFRRVDLDEFIMHNLHCAIR